jgi:hypothetical protein
MKNRPTRFAARLLVAATLWSLAGCAGNIDVSDDGTIQGSASITLPPPPTCGVMYAGHALAQGQSLASCDGRYRLTMQPDGNLVVYYSYSHSYPLWASGTNGRGGYSAVMQTDGNLVVYTASNSAVWAAGTYGHGGANLFLQDDGNLVIYDSNGKALWSSHTWGIPRQSTTCGTLTANQGLGPGDSLVSCGGDFHLDLGRDGNLSLYNTGGDRLWQSNTGGKGARYAIMQGDGNLVLYPTGGGRAVWASNTANHGGSWLELQGDGNLVIYAPGHTPIWATGTNGRASTGLMIWPNSASSANSDRWISNNDYAIQQMRPKVLVINFADHPSGANVPMLVAQTISGLAEGSRYHGSQDPSAPVFIDYQLVKIVDATDDGYPPSGWNHLNSSYYPFKCKSGPYGFDYSALFGGIFTDLIGIADPSDESQLLSLGQLVQRGMVNEVWLAVDGDPDAYTCPNGYKYTDFQLLESPELKQVYNASDQPIAGQFNPCSGNGCFDTQDAATIRALGRSLRIGYMNTTRQAGDLIHSLGHAFEWSAAPGGPLPRLSPLFQPFGNFDLDKRFGVRFHSWYDICSDQAPKGSPPNTPVPACVTFADNNDLEWIDTDYTGGWSTDNEGSGYMGPYDQGCGNVHFPPNAQRPYDYDNGYGVLSRCEHYGLHDGPSGGDATEIYTNAKARKYESAYPEGGWQIYWRQNFPGLGNQAYDDQWIWMKNWWPYLFY